MQTRTDWLLHALRLESCPFLWKQQENWHVIKIKFNRWLKLIKPNFQKNESFKIFTLSTLSLFFFSLSINQESETKRGMKWRENWEEEELKANWSARGSNGVAFGLVFTGEFAGKLSEKIGGGFGFFVNYMYLYLYPYIWTLEIGKREEDGSI